MDPDDFTVMGNDCTEELYNGIPGIRSTWLKHVLRSPAHWLKQVTQPPEPTDRQRRGILLHQSTLMGIESIKMVIAPDDISLSTKAGIALKERAREEGAQLLRQSTLDDMQGIRRGVLSDPELQSILTRSMKEVSLFSTVKVRGENDLCKARLDLVPEGDFLCDLKFTNDARSDAFVRKIMEYGYHMQAFHYLSVWNAAANNIEKMKEPPPIEVKPRRKFMLVAIEDEAPYGIRKYTLSEEFMDLAESRWRMAVATLQRCLDEQNFPAYTDSVAELGPPKWMNTDKYILEEF